jgi:hypothetical protein
MHMLTVLQVQKADLSGANENHAAAGAPKGKKRVDKTRGLSGMLPIQATFVTAAADAASSTLAFPACLSLLPRVTLAMAFCPFRRREVVYDDVPHPGPVAHYGQPVPRLG